MCIGMRRCSFFGALVGEGFLSLRSFPSFGVNGEGYFGALVRDFLSLRGFPSFELVSLLCLNSFSKAKFMDESNVSHASLCRKDFDTDVACAKSHC